MYGFITVDHQCMYVLPLWIPRYVSITKLVDQKKEGGSVVMGMANIHSPTQNDIPIPMFPFRDGKDVHLG